MSASPLPTRRKPGFAPLPERSSGLFRHRTGARRGGALPAVLIFATVILAISGALLALAQTNMRLTHRNEFRAMARAVVETELEHLFFSFKEQLASGVDPADVPLKLAALADSAALPASTRLSYLTLHRTANWQIKRAIDLTASVNGIDAVTGDYGTTNYFDVRVEALPNSDSLWAGSPTRYGRQFSTTLSSIFQKCVFYQGDLEMNPGGDVTLDGDIMATGSIYLGPSGDGKLTINGMVYHPADKGLNTDPVDDIFGNADDITGVYRNPKSSKAGAQQPPLWKYGQDQQVRTLSVLPNFTGGTDPGALQASNNTLFPTVNDVYRALIVPPPSAGNTNEYADTSIADVPDMKDQRLYNRAGMIVTVDSAGAVTIQTRSGKTLTDVTSTYSSALAATKKVWDQREGREVAITEIDIGKLKGLTGGTGVPDNILYVNLKNGTAASPAAVRLVNAEELPGGAAGFTLATNGGLYVKGDYNTKDGLGISTRPSMLMADAITALSADWNDANAANTDVTARKAKTDLTIRAGLLVGNTPASDTNVSGGVQNLVRFLEDWGEFDDGNGNTVKLTVTFKGSFGRLFDSKMFTRPFQQPDTVYMPPSFRNFVFDAKLREGSGPPGGIRLYRSARGRFFQW